jgi:hypothetical protein
MTEKTETLVQIMEILENLETLISLNNLIAAGLTTDPEVIRDVARASSELLTMQLVGTRLLLDPSTSKVVQHGIDMIADV